MNKNFWIKRGLLVLVISFSIIFTAQYFKSNNLYYALGQAALWSAVASAIYLSVLWNKIRKNPSCAIKSQEEIR
jgi:ribose/xylose/arabinose/galactoside ABC-type transport system permease subunit